jgi:predicted nucleotidyltransferase
MVALSQAARALGADERTFRRAAALGTVRCHRESPRRRQLDDREVAYLVEHWELLAELRRALRTEPNVRLAVLFGSAARGDDRSSSDADMLVSLREDRPDAAVRLAVRLERALGRPVDVARLNRIEDDAPLLLLQAIDEGRVIIDRDGEWPELQAARSAIARYAQLEQRENRRAAAAAVRALQQL